MHSLNRPEISTAVKEFLFKDKHEMHIKISGDSMNPIFPNGSLIKISRHTGALRPGKCYVFKRDSLLIVHRLLFCYRSKAVFSSENGRRIDIVPRKHVVGHVVKQEKTFLRYSNLSFTFCKACMNVILKKRVLRALTFLG